MNADSTVGVLSAENVAAVAAWRRMARDDLRAIADRGDPGRVNRDLVAVLGDRGLIAEMLPADDSPERAAISSLSLCLMREALAQEAPAAETALAVQGLGGYPILQFGSPRIRREWAARIIQGSAIAAFALTEPTAGSDVGALQLTAERLHNGFSLNGTKTFISNAPDADLYTLFARTKPGAGTKGITAFAIPGDSSGLAGEHLALLSPHPVGRLHLHDVFVAEDQVLGEVDRGFSVAMQTLSLFRPSVGAFAVGLAQSALDAAIAHVNDRMVFGRPLAEMQAISHRLADLATRLHASRLLVYSAAITADSTGHPSPIAAAMAKLFATETAQTVVDFAIQVHGAVALEHGHLLEHLYREVRAPRIYEGASEVQREIIARKLLAHR